MSTALVVGAGGLTGAYSAGAVAEFGRTFGNKHFNAVYASSVGVFAGAFFASGQYDTIENTWRNLVDGTKLVNFSNPIRGRAIMDLEYLVEIFKDNRSLLSVGRLMESGIPITVSITEALSGCLVRRRVTKENIFSLMTASCAMPLFHWPVVLGERSYIDGGLSDPIPVEKALWEGHRKIVVVYNKPAKVYTGREWRLFVRWLCWLFRANIRDLMRSYEHRVNQLVNIIEHDKRVFAIRPSEPLPLRTIVDTNKRRLNQAIDMGIKDVRRLTPQISKFLYADA